MLDAGVILRDSAGSRKGTSKRLPADDKDRNERGLLVAAVSSRGVREEAKGPYCLGESALLNHNEHGLFLPSGVSAQY